MATNRTAEPSPLDIRRVIYDKILLFGDSLRSLAATSSRSPRGYGGYSSDHLRHVLIPTIRAETAAGESIKLLVIEVGTNDAAMNEMQHVPASRYRQNLTWMVETSRNTDVERVIIVGLGPVDEARLEDPKDKTAARNLEYTLAARDVAEKCRVPFLDLRHSFMSTAGWTKGAPLPGEGSTICSALSPLLTDGVHFTGKGYRIWYDELLQIISKEFPELESGRLCMVLPHIFDVDRSNLPASLWQEIKLIR